MANPALQASWARARDKALKVSPPVTAFDFDGDDPIAWVVEGSRGNEYVVRATPSPFHYHCSCENGVNGDSNTVCYHVASVALLPDQTARRERARAVTVANRIATEIPCPGEGWVRSPGGWVCQRADDPLMIFFPS